MKRGWSIETPMSPAGPIVVVELDRDVPWAMDTFKAARGQVYTRQEIGYLREAKAAGATDQDLRRLISTKAMFHGVIVAGGRVE